MVIFNFDTKFQNMLQKSNRSTKFFFKKISPEFEWDVFAIIKKILLLPRVWRDGRVVDRGGLENR